MTVHDLGNNTLTIQITRGGHVITQLDQNYMEPNMWPPPDEEDDEEEEEEDGDEEEDGAGETATEEQSILFVDRLFGELTTKERAQVMLYKQILDASDQPLRFNESA